MATGVLERLTSAESEEQAEQQQAKKKAWGEYRKLVTTLGTGGKEPAEAKVRSILDAADRSATQLAADVKSFQRRLDMKQTADSVEDLKAKSSAAMRALNEFRNVERREAERKLDERERELSREHSSFSLPINQALAARLELINEMPADIHHQLRQSRKERERLCLDVLPLKKKEIDQAKGAVRTCKDRAEKAPVGPKRKAAIEDFEMARDHAARLQEEHDKLELHVHEMVQAEEELIAQSILPDAFLDEVE